MRQRHRLRPSERQRVHTYPYWQRPEHYAGAGSLRHSQKRCIHFGEEPVCLFRNWRNAATWLSTSHELYPLEDATPQEPAFGPTPVERLPRAPVRPSARRLGGRLFTDETYDHSDHDDHDNDDKHDTYPWSHVDAQRHHH